MRGVVMILKRMLASMDNGSLFRLQFMFAKSKVTRIVEETIYMDRDPKYVAGQLRKLATKLDAE